MKCSNCGNELIRSRAGWLCISCGNVQPDAPGVEGTTSQISTGREPDAPIAASAPTPATPTQPAPTDAASVPLQPEPEAAQTDQPQEPDGGAASTIAAVSASDDAPGKGIEVAEPAGSLSPIAPTDEDLNAVEEAVAKVEAAAATGGAAADADTMPAQTESDPPAENNASEPDAAAIVKPHKGKKRISPDKPKPVDKKNLSAAGEAATSAGAAAIQASAPEPAPEAESEPAPEPAPEAESEPPPEPPVADSPASPEPEDIADEIPEAAPAPAPEAAPTVTEPPVEEAPADNPAVTGPSFLPASDVPPSLEQAMADEPKEAGEASPPPTDAPPAAASYEPPATASESSPAPPVAQQAPPPPPAGPMPLNGRPPLMPVTHPRPGRFNLAAKIIAAVVVVSAVAGAVFLYVFSPKIALGDYMARLVAAKTTTISATVSEVAEADSIKFALKLNGGYDLTDTQKPKLDLNITGQASIADGTAAPLGGGASGSLAGHIILADQAAYFKLESLSALNSLLPIKISNDWYKYDLGSTDSSNCSKPAKGSGSFLGSTVITKLPIKNASFAGLDTVAGFKALHYKGTIDNSKIQGIIDEANKNLSADCKLTISADDFKNVSITYDLWRGWSKDRIHFSVVDSSSKTNLDTVMDTGSYNKKITITAPAGAKDAAQLLKDLFTGGDTPAIGDAAPVDPATSHNNTRKNELAILAAKLEESAANNNGTYPSTASALAKIADPASDPLTNKPYVFTGAKLTAVGQIQYLLGYSCNAAGTAAVLAKPANQRLYTLTTLLDDGKTAYCIDNH